MYAIIVTGGKQYTVQEGEILYIEKLDAQAEEKVTFDDVLLVSKDSGMVVGTPVIDGAKVEATVVKHGRAKKIHIFKHKPKKGYRRRMGHRQSYTKVQIDSIICA